MDVCLTSNVGSSYNYETPHMVLDSEKYLEERLYIKENYAIIEECPSHLGSVYNRVEDYMLYKWFQGVGEELHNLGVETGVYLGGSYVS